MNTKFNRIRTLALVAVFATMISVGINIQAADPHQGMKGARHLMHLNSPKQADELKTGDTIAMVCSMCKNVMVQRVERERGRGFMRPGMKHLCPGCGGTIEVSSQRIDKKEVIKHTCSKCGTESAFCCATKPGTGTTEGVEKEKK